MTSRRWIVTAWVDDVDEALADAHTGGTLRYGLGQRERCPTTDRLHWQLYLEFRSPVRNTAVRRAVGDTTAWCEHARGSRASCRDYVTKEDTRIPGTKLEYGQYTEGGQGTRNDINSALGLVRGGVTPSTIASLYDDHGETMVKFNRGMQAAVLHYMAREVRTEPPRVLVHYGSTGTGKTHAVYARHPMSDVWRAPVSHTGSAWFDNYWGQPVALFDDFDGEHPSITMMLQVLDKYPLQVPVKTSHVPWLPKTIYITSNLAPTEWYPGASQRHKDALLRRITESIHFKYLDGRPSDDDEIPSSQ